MSLLTSQPASCELVRAALAAAASLNAARPAKATHSSVSPVLKAGEPPWIMQKPMPTVADG